MSIDSGFRTLDGDIPVGMLANPLFVVQLDGPLPAIRRQRPHQDKRHPTMLHDNLSLEVNRSIVKPVPPRGERAIKSKGAGLTYDTAPVDALRHDGRRSPARWTVTNLQNMTDESLLAYYESIRRQIAADRQLGGRFRLVGGTVKQYADCLKDEIRRRQLAFQPIDWPL